MKTILESEGQVYATLKLTASKEYITMIRKALDIELDICSEDTIYFSNKNVGKMKLTMIRILKLWAEIEKTGESYLYIIDPNKEAITIAEGDNIEVIDLYSIRAREIFLEYFSDDIEAVSI